MPPAGVAARPAKVGRWGSDRVTIEPAVDVGVEELIAFVAAVVAPFKKVRAIEFIEKIPKSPSGKILRRELIARERARRSGAAGTPAGG